MICSISELAKKLPRSVERIDGAVAKISYQDRAWKCSEGSRGCHQAPRRVELCARPDEGAHEIAVEVEDINLPHPGARLRIVLAGILHGIRDIDLISDHVNAVRSESRRKVWIGERPAQRSGTEVAIQNVYLATVEVCRQKKSAVEYGKPFVDRTAGGIIKGNRCCVAGAGPVSYEAVFSIKNKLPATKIAAVAIGHGTRRTSGTAIAIGIACGARYGHHEPSVFRALIVIERGGATVIVGDPEIRSRNKGNSPGIEKLRILCGGYAGCIRDQVGLG